MNNREGYSFEAERISLYLIRRKPGEREKNIYADALQRLEINFSPAEEKLWSRMLQSRFRMAIVDAGLALVNPDSLLRRRIYTMLAILEASPAYTSYFLSDPSASFFKMMLAGVRAAFRAVVGYFMLRLLWRECC